MQTIAFNKMIVLMQVKTGQGHSRIDEIVDSKTVWANVQEPSMSLQMTAANIGMSADRVLHLWRREFEKGSYNRVVIGGVVYRIENIGASVNDNFVKLIVSRSRK